MMEGSGIVRYKPEFDELFYSLRRYAPARCHKLKDKYLSVNFTDEAVINFNVLFFESEIVFL